MAEHEHDNHGHGHAAHPAVEVIQHPEPLHAWIRMCCAFMDNGSSWLEEPRPKAEEMLRRDWQISDRGVLQQALGQLTQGPPTACVPIRGQDRAGAAPLLAGAH